MPDITIGLHIRYEDGTIGDAEHAYSLADFAGVLPMIGDEILDPGVAAGQDRSLPENREFLTIVGRVFNALDRRNYVALICEGRVGTGEDETLVPLYDRSAER